MRPHRFTKSPRAVRHAKLDNLALVPASLLLYKDPYQQLANDLPTGNILIILPEKENLPIARSLVLN
jgi:hypothetical protein